MIVDILARKLAPIFDKLKVNNPLLYTLIVATAVGIHAGVDQVVDSGAFPGADYLILISKTLTVMVPILVNTRTFNYLPKEEQEERIQKSNIK